MNERNWCLLGQLLVSQALFKKSDLSVQDNITGNKEPGILSSEIGSGWFLPSGGTERGNVPFLSCP